MLIYLDTGMMVVNLNELVSTVLEQPARYSIQACCISDISRGQHSFNLMYLHGEQVVQLRRVHVAVLSLLKVGKEMVQLPC